MLKEEFEELIKREVNGNQYKNIETAYEALPEYMDKMYLASAISNDIGKAINVLSFFRIVYKRVNGFDNNRKAKGGIMCL